MTLPRPLLFCALLALPCAAAAAGNQHGAAAHEGHVGTQEGGTKVQDTPPPPNLPQPEGRCKDGGACYTPEQLDQIHEQLGQKYPVRDLPGIIKDTLTDPRVLRGEITPREIGALDKFLDLRMRAGIAYRRAKNDNDPAAREEAIGLARAAGRVMAGPLKHSEIHEALMDADKYGDKMMKIMDGEGYKRSEPNNPASWGYSARDLLGEGKYAEALKDADRAVQLGGGSSALSARSSAHLGLGDYENAVADANAALELDPDDKVAMANLKMSEGRVSADMAGSPSAGIAPSPEYSEAHGRGFMDGGPMGGMGLAVGAQRPGAAAAARFNEQARGALTMGDHRAALDFAARALAADPASVASYYLRAMAYRRQGDWKSSAEEAAKGLEVSPRDAALLAARATALNRMKDYKGALEVSSRALEMNPRDAWAYANRAYALGGLGDREGMIGSLRQAARIETAFQAALDSALQRPEDADLLFMFPGESAPARTGAAAAGAARRGRNFGLVTGFAALGGLLLALGLLSTVLKPLQERVTSAFTRLARGGPAVTTAAEAPAARGAGLLRSQYELGRQIGAGGMGLVYEGTDRSLGRRVAVKRMRDEIRLDPRERARFVSEAKTVAALHHPNIVDIYAVVEEGDDLHLVFEFVEGRTVHELVSGKGRLAPAQAAKIVRGAADALDFAHSRGVIHRDMKPSNLMIDDTGRVKVMDFGIARAAKEAMTRYSMTNTVVGTPPYMAPEQEQGHVRKESDVYSLAVCAYELLCGRLPFPGVGAGMLMNKINQSYVPPAKMAEGLPAALDEVFAKAFQPDPDKRYRSSGEFAAAFEAAVSAPV